MNCTIRERKSSLRALIADANSCGPKRGTADAGTANPVIDSVIASIIMRCKLVRPPAGAAAAATPPAMSRASAASGGSSFS